MEEEYLYNDDELLKLRKKKKQFVDEIDSQIKDLEAKQEVLKEQIIREYLEDGVCPSGIIHIKKLPRGVIVTDESKIPDQFFKIERKLDKKALNEAVKGGETIDGVTLDNGGYTIMIRG